MVKRKAVIWALLVSIMISWLSCGTLSLASGKVKLSKKNVILMKGKTCKIKLKSAKSKKVRWKSSNRKIVTVNKKGLIKARRKGRCLVIAKYRGKKYVCKVTVKKDKKITKTPKPETSSSPISPSASPQCSSVPDQVAGSNTIELVIDTFDQKTKNIKYSITNMTDGMITLTSFYTLGKFENDMWLDVPRKTDSVRADAMFIMPAEKISMETNLNNDYENLSGGKYRMCIQTSCGKVFAEFEIG